MNKLKKYAGLLNDAAPKGEFLAYINDDEAKMLKAAGGQGILTNSGILSFRPSDYSPSASARNYSPSRSSSKSSGSHSRSYNPGAGGVVQHSPTKSKTTSNTGGGRDPTQQFSNTPPPSQMAKETLAKQRETLRDNINPPTFADQVKDVISQGGIALSVLNTAANAHNEWRRDRWFSGKEKTTLLGDKPMPLSRDFYIMHNRPYDKKNLMIEGTPEHNMLKDSGYFEHINKSSNNNDRNDNNPQSYFDYSEDFSEKLITQPDPVSQVNQYFSNMGNTNLGISSNYTNTYNQAKANLAKSLNMTPNTQQYGYTANPYSQYPSTMTSVNPFFDELTEQGLI